MLSGGHPISLGRTLEVVEIFLSEADKLDEYHFGNNANENYTLANQNYRFKTGWLIGDIQTTQTIKFLWEYQISNIIDLALGFSHIKGMDESINTISVQVNVDY